MIGYTEILSKNNSRWAEMEWKSERTCCVLVSTGTPSIVMDGMQSMSGGDVIMDLRGFRYPGIVSGVISPSGGGYLLCSLAADWRYLESSGSKVVEWASFDR